MITPRDSYRSISLYAPDRAPCRIDLSDNTNLWGIPPAARRVLAEAAGPVITRYPNLYAQALKEAIGRYIGVSPTEIVTGCGSDDVLDSAVRAFAEPGDVLAWSEPSFAMLPYFAKMNALKGVAVPLGKAFALDVDALLATKAKLLYVCSPNNPTGTLAERAAIARLLKESTGVVIVDEAYAEYAADAWTKEAPGHDRLLCVRTFSKAFGLAGLRVGYAVGAPELVAEVEKSRGPYKVNNLGERMAVAAIDHDLPWIRDHISEVKTNRARFQQALEAAGFGVVPSEANFLLVRVAEATQTAKRMRGLGVGIRPFADLPQLGQTLRISIGPWEMMEECLAMLKQEAKP